MSEIFACFSNMQRKGQFFNKYRKTCSDVEKHIKNRIYIEKRIKFGGPYGIEPLLMLQAPVLPLHSTTYPGLIPVLCSYETNPALRHPTTGPSNN